MAHESALPAEFGNWNSIWKRFWRLSQSGVFEAFFEALAAMSDTPRYDRSRLRYPSDLTDEEWAHVAPVIPPRM